MMISPYQLPADMVSSVMRGEQSMAGKSKKNTGSVYDEDQLELFPDSLLSQDPEIQNSKLLDPDDRMPYGTLTYRENHDKMKDVVLGFLGKGSEMTGLEVYSKLYYIDEETRHQVDDSMRVQDSDEDVFEIMADGSKKRTFRSNPVAYMRTVAEDASTGRFRIIHRDTLPQILKELQEAEFAILSAVTFFGGRNVMDHAGLLTGFIIDLDGCTPETVNALFMQVGYELIPKPNVVVMSGRNLHLIYMLAPAVSIANKAMQRWCRWIKFMLTHFVFYNRYTSLIKEPHSQGLSQGFRVIGGPSKIRGIKVEAFMGEADKYTLSELEAYITPTDEKRAEGRFIKPPKPETRMRTPLPVAKEKWPEWWNSVEESERTGIPRTRGTWVCNPALYEWWKKKITEPGNCVVGRRYLSTTCLAVYARKCGISFEKLHEDAMKIRVFFDAIGQPLYPFTEQDVEDALRIYYLPHAPLYSRQTISNISGIAIPKPPTPFLDAYNARMERAAARAGREYVPEKMTRQRWLEVEGREMAWRTQKELGIEWRNRKGPPVKYPRLKEWIERHPYGTVSQAASDKSLGLSFNTISAHWAECGGIPKTELVDRWLRDHPGASADECVAALGIHKKTAQRHIRQCKKRLDG